MKYNLTQIILVGIFVVIVISETLYCKNTYAGKAPKSDSLIQSISLKQDSILILLKKQENYFDEQMP